MNNKLLISLVFAVAACAVQTEKRSTLLDAPTPPADDAGAPGADSSPAPDASDASPPPDAAPPMETPYCSPTAVFGAGVGLALPGSGPKALSAMTADELTLAWTTSDGAIHYADRASTADTFASAQDLDMTGVATGEHVALGQDGLTLYAISTDGHAILAYTRGTRGDALSGPTNSTMDLLDTEGAAMSSGERFSDLSISASGTTLVVRWAGGSSPGLRSSHRVVSSDPWSATSPFATQPELSVSGSMARRPTGLSTDSRALFYFDETTGTEKTAFFGQDAVVASQFVDEGSRAHLQANADCTVLYYDTAGTIYGAARE